MLNEMEKKDIDKKKKYKSKTFIENQENELVKINSTFDFANLYTSATETSLILKKKSKHKSTNDEISNQNQNEINSLEDTPVRNNKKFSKSELKKLKTSTPNAPDEKHSISSQQTAFVKSIMKNSTLDNDASDSYNEIPVTAECGKRKKRTKSVSFMLDDNNEVSKKKSKPNKYGLEPSNLVSKSKEKKKNVKAIENNEHYITHLDQAILKSDVVITTKKKKKKDVNTDISVLDENKLKNVNKSINNAKKIKNNSLVSDEKERTITLNQISGNEEFQKSKKDKKKTNTRKMTEGEVKNDNIDRVTEEKNVKNKNKKKRKHKIPNVEANKEESDKKATVKADNVVDDLESLSIGDNAHTLSNLLDEMTVVDKNKKRKIKKNVKKTDTSEKSLETDGKEKKERDKWKKRRLQRKPEFRGNDVTTSIIVDNLPLKLLFDYKDLLREHFSKFGLIRRIGVAEVYPTEEPKPVFTTTVYFFSEEAATSALEEDNTAFNKGRMRVRRPLPPTDTTLIVKCHSPLDESTLSSTFLSCGRIRSIRKVEKSKKSISSAFIEFNHPQEVEKAVKLSSTLRIGGKKVYIAKFEIRNKKQEGKEDEVNGEL